jgi:hypothetical protein
MKLLDDYFYECHLAEIYAVADKIMPLNVIPQGSMQFLDNYFYECHLAEIYAVVTKTNSL